jgi:riboflavin transporter FmnP
MTFKDFKIGLFAGLSYVLQLFHLPYKHLGFLEFEFSDIPAVIAALQYGPLAGIVIELIKNLIKGLTASTTAGVGELTNFLISAAFILPIGFLYKFRNKNNTKDRADKSKQWNHAYIVLIFTIGVISMVVTGALLNYFVMVPLYAKFFGGMDSVIGFASKNVPLIKDLGSLVIIGITPFNIVKGITLSIVGYYTYRLLKGRIL